MTLPGTSANSNRPAGSRTTTLPYVAGLDGIRAIAVVAVILYHGQDVSPISSVLKPQGGFLGVEVFFVISGFLITALLVDEHDTTRRIDLTGFWIRRARRLLPALYLFLFGTISLAALFGTDALDKIRREILGAVFYVSNWVLLINEESYFEAAGRPSLLRHLWSLAIEEQFYLLWPLVVAVGLRWGGRRILAAFTAVGVLGSTALLWLLFDRVDQFGDVSRVYYRTDARAAALLVGATLALVWKPWRDGSAAHRLGAAGRAAIEVVGLISLAALIGMQYAFTDRVIEWASYERLYHGGFLALSLTTVLLIVAITVPDSRLNAVLGNAAMRWIGTRSYGLYLWHWPIFQLTRPRVDVDINGYGLFFIRLAITFALTELSYRLVEVPIRRRTFLAQASTALRSPRGIGLITGAALCLIAATASIAIALPTIDRGQNVAVAALADEASGDVSATTNEPAVSNDPAPDDSTEFTNSLPEEVASATPAPTATGVFATPTPLVIPAAAEPVSGDGAAPPLPIPTPADPEAWYAQMPTPTPTQPPLPPPPPLSEPFDIATSRIHIVGDSVVAGAHGNLLRISPQVTVDGRIGRQWWELEAELRQMRSQGLGNDVVVIQLGNNGPFTTQMFDGVMQALHGTRLVLFINIHAPVLWEGEVNAMLERNVNRYESQARLLDWYSVSNAHPEFFVEDDTHLQGDGIRAFRQLIEGALVNLG